MNSSLPETRSRYWQRRGNVYFRFPRRSSSTRLYLPLPSRPFQNWYVTSESVILCHARIENSTSWIWGTDKRSKTSSELLHEAFPQSNPSLVGAFNEWRAIGNCLYCRATSPALQNTHRNHSSGKSPALPANDRLPMVHCGRCVWPEMKRQTMICYGRLWLNADLCPRSTTSG